MSFLAVTPYGIKDLLHANFLRAGNKNIDLHFMWFLHIDITKLLEIFPQVRQGPTYST